MKQVSSLILILILILPASSHAADVLENVGIIPGNIWYSSYPLQAGTEVKVFTAVFNGSVYTVEGMVSFSDNGQHISKAPFLITAGQLSEVFIVWIPKQGSHKVSAAITEIKTVSQGKAAEPAKLETVVTAQGIVQVAPPPPPPPIPKITDIAAITATTSNALLVAQNSAGAFAALASSSVNKAASAVATILPNAVATPIKKAVTAVNTLAENTKKNVDVTREAVRANLAAEKARDNQLAAALSQVSALGGIAPLRFLKSLYDKATQFLSSAVLGDLPSKVTAAQEGSGGVKTPLSYLWFFLLSIIAFVLGHLWLLWVLLIFVCYKIVRFLYRKFIQKDAYSY